MPMNSVVSREEWLQARLAHLEKEKELTRQRDALSAERRQLPWVRVDKNYVFQGPNGEQALLEAFRERIGHEIRIEVRLVEHIEREPGGKLRAVKSAIAPQAREGVVR